MPGTYPGFHRNGLKPLLGYGVDRAHPLARGLVAAWLFNEGGGASAFDIFAGQKINFSGASPWSAGTDGHAPKFNGTTQYGSSAAPVSLAAQFSVVASVVPSGTQSAYSRVAETDYATGFFLGVNTAGSKYDFIVNSSGLESCIGGTVATGATARLAGTYDGGTLRLYVNGAVVGTTTVAGPGATSKTLYVATQQVGPGTGGLAGQVNHLYLYNGALSAADVAWLHAEPYAFVQAPAARRFYAPTTQTGGPFPWFLDNALAGGFQPMGL